jgi:hypothetical protein
MSLHCLTRRAHFVLLVCIAVASASNATAAHIPGMSQLGGWVYVDRNNDGQLAFSNEPNPEFAIPNVTVSLFSIANNVETLARTLQTDAHGRYLFENIAPGKYSLREIQPIEFVDGKDTLGVLQSLNAQPIPPAASPGTAGSDFFTNIVLTADVGGEFYTFGELGLTAAFASKRDLLTSSPPPPLAGVPEPATLLFVLAAAGCAVLTIGRSR